MGLCSPRACGCAVSSETLEILGSGAAGDPYEIEATYRLNNYGVERDMTTGDLLFLGGSSVVITNGSGVATVTFGVTFLNSPLLTAWGGDSGVSVNLDLTGATPSTTSFTFAARNHLGAIIVSGSVRVNWTAIGLVAS